MADASYAQSSFLGGEVSKTMQGRFDTREYRTFMDECLNGLPIEQGPWTRRPGFRHLGTTRRGLNGRLIPFSFKAASPVLMEFTDLHMRFWSGTQLVMSDDGNFVTDISATTPPVITTQTAHGWSTNNEVQFQLPGTTCAPLQNRQFLITVIDLTHFSLQDDESGFAIDGSALGWALPTTPVEVTRVLDVGALYQVAGGAAGKWENIRSVQTETTAVLLNGYPPYRVDATLGNPYPTFAWTKIAFSDGPYLDAVAGAVLTPNAVSGTITFTLNNLAYVNNGVGFTSADVGRMIRVFSEPKPWPGAGTGVAGDIVSYGGGYWIQQVAATTTAPGSVGVFAAPTQAAPSTSTPVAAVQSGLGPPGLAAASSTVQPAATVPTIVGADTVEQVQWLPLTVVAAAGWRWGTIGEVVDSSHIKVSNLSANLVANTPVNTFRLGVYGGLNGWPVTGVYHEGRLWLSGAVDNRIDASNSNDIFNFAPTTTDGTVLESNSIAATFNSDDVNPIYWMVSDEKGIICGTQAGEWLVAPANTGNAMSPFNISAHRVTKNGCANVEPKRTEHTIVVVQKFLRKLLEFFADVYSGRFAAPNLSMTWKHLTKAFIAEIAYQQELAPVVWQRLVDGTLIGMSYKRDSLTSSQGPAFAGGHRHVLGSGWKVKSIATGSNDLGTLDALTIVTYDASTNIYHVEQLTDLFEEGSIKSKAWFVDAGVRPSSQKLTEVDGVAVYQLNGLWHLNGYTVAAYIGGLDCGDYRVASGTMNIPLEGDPHGLLTSDYILNGQATGGIDTLVGFSFTSRGRCVRPATAAESGARNGPGIFKVRRSQQAGILLQDSAGISWGTSFDAVYPVPLQSAGGVDITPFEMFSGLVQDTIEDGYSLDGALCWEISRPFPATVVAIGGFLHTQDK